MPLAHERTGRAASASQESVPAEEYEFDVRPVLRFLVRYAIVIMASIIAALIAATAVTMLKPATYRAVSRVHVKAQRTQVVLEPRFQATDVFEIKAFITQAKHPAVENAVREKLGHLLEPSEMEPGNLSERIQIQTDRVDNTLMEIVVFDRDRRRASAIANAWADVFVTHAQATMNPSAVTQKLVDSLLREAKTEFDRRETMVRAFEAGTGLGLEVGALAATVDRRGVRAPESGTGRRLPTRIDDATRVGDSAAGNDDDSTTQSSSSSLGGRVGTRGQDIVRRSQTIAALGTELDRLRVLKEQTRRLRDLNLPPSTIQPDLDRSGIAANQPIAAVLGAVEAKELATLSTIDSGTRELRGLEIKLVSDLNELAALERERDFARDTYVLLTKKAEENKIGLAGEWAAVRLFKYAPEMAPVDPPPWTITLAIAGSAGLIVGIALGFGIDVSKRRRATIAA